MIQWKDGMGGGVINHNARAFTLTNRVPEWGLKYGETHSALSIINTLFG